jgi:hypothetical protein
MFCSSGYWNDRLRDAAAVGSGGVQAAFGDNCAAEAPPKAVAYGTLGFSADRTCFMSFQSGHGLLLESKGRRQGAPPIELGPLLR